MRDKKDAWIKDNYHHYNVDLPETRTKWKAKLVPLNVLFQLEKICVLSAENFENAFISLNQGMIEISIQILNIKYGVKPPHQFWPIFRKMSDMNSPMLSIKNAFSSLSWDTSSIIKSFATLNSLADNYESLKLHSIVLTKEIEKLTNETPAELLIQPEYVKKLNDSFSIFSKITEMAEIAASKVNYVDKVLEIGILEFEVQHSEKLLGFLENYVNEKLETSKRIVSAIESLKT